jgi:hypothetical protein
MKILSLSVLCILWLVQPANAQTCSGLHRMVDGNRVCLTAGEEASLRAEWSVWDAAIPGRKKNKAQDEAERREDMGVVANGIMLRTDSNGLSRLQGLMVSAQRKEAAGLAVDIRGRTMAGVKVVVTSADQAEAMFDAASGHVEAVQAALDTLMDEIDTMTLAQLKALDVRAWAGWP